jgi:hypothetical protein
MQFQQANSRAEAANKFDLEVEKERESCHVFLLCFLVYRGPMRGGHITVGAQHVRVCVVEDTDPTPVDQISRSQGVRLHTHRADLLDRRRLYCHSIIRDSES